MHPASVAAIESARNDKIATASALLVSQIKRGLASNPIRGKSFFLGTPFYEVETDLRLFGMPITYVRSEIDSIMCRAFEEIKGLGFMKVRYDLYGTYCVKIRLYFGRAAIFK